MQFLFSCRLSAEFGDIYTIPVSAEKECFLQRMQKEGYIQYERGSDHIGILDCPSLHLTNLEKVKADVIKRWVIQEKIVKFDYFCLLCAY